MTKLNSAKKSVICKDCGHTGAPKARLTGKVFLYIPFLFVFLVVSLGLGIIVLVVAYFFMRVDTCTVCGSENVEEGVAKTANGMPFAKDQGTEGLEVVAADSSQRTEGGTPAPSTEPSKPSGYEIFSLDDGKNRLVACKECGNMISRKAEICPKCGFRYRPSAQSNSGPGFIVSLFKLVGGVVGAVIGLMVAVSFLEGRNNKVSPTQIFGSGGDSVTPARQLEIRCEEGANTQPEGTERRAFYERCVATGLSVIRSQERINAEGSQK